MRLLVQRDLLITFSMHLMNLTSLFTYQCHCWNMNLLLLMQSLLFTLWVRRFIVLVSFPYTPSLTFLIYDNSSVSLPWSLKNAFYCQSQANLVSTRFYCSFFRMFLFSSMSQFFIQFLMHDLAWQNMYFLQWPIILFISYSFLLQSTTNFFHISIPLVSPTQ